MRIVIIVIHTAYGKAFGDIFDGETLFYCKNLGNNNDVRDLIYKYKPHIVVDTDYNLLKTDDDEFNMKASVIYNLFVPFPRPQTTFKEDLWQNE